MKKLSPRDKRALTIGVVTAGLILIYVFANEFWLNHWAPVRMQITQHQDKLARLGLDDSPAARARRDMMWRKVPVFEPPQAEDQQRLLFARKFEEQVKKAGVKLTTMPQYQSHIRSQPELGLNILRLHCQGKGNFSQVMDLLAALYENPYLVSIDDFQLKCDPKKRQEIEMTLTISTFAR